MSHRSVYISLSAYRTLRPFNRGESVLLVLVLVITIAIAITNDRRLRQCHGPMTDDRQVCVQTRRLPEVVDVHVDDLFAEHVDVKVVLYSINSHILMQDVSTNLVVTYGNRAQRIIMGKGQSVKLTNRRVVQSLLRLLGIRGI